MNAISDYPSLVKDPKTGVVQNRNRTGLQRAKEANRRLKESAKKTEDLEERIAKLEKIIMELSNNG